jgi:hypothetical protein
MAFHPNTFDHRTGRVQACSGVTKEKVREIKRLTRAATYFYAPLFLDLSLRELVVRNGGGGGSWAPRHDSFYTTY